MRQQICKTEEWKSALGVLCIDNLKRKPILAKKLRIDSCRRIKYGYFVTAQHRFLCKKTDRASILLLAMKPMHWLCSAGDWKLGANVVMRVKGPEASAINRLVVSVGPMLFLCLPKSSRLASRLFLIRGVLHINLSKLNTFHTEARS